MADATVAEGYTQVRSRASIRRAASTTQHQATPLLRGGVQGRGNGTHRQVRPPVQVPDVTRPPAPTPPAPGPQRRATLTATPDLRRRPLPLPQTPVLLPQAAQTGENGQQTAVDSPAGTDTSRASQRVIPNLDAGATQNNELPEVHDSRYGRSFPGTHFVVGNIISIYQHTPEKTVANVAWNAPLEKNCYRNGSELVYSKLRKMIIIKRFYKHCVAVPLYTHAGSGMRGKALEWRKEHIGVVDSKEPKPWVTNYTPYDNIVATRADYWRGEEFGRVRAYAMTPFAIVNGVPRIPEPLYPRAAWAYFRTPQHGWFDAPVTVAYSTRFIYEGTVDADAVARLVELVCETFQVVDNDA